MKLFKYWALVLIMIGQCLIAQENFAGPKILTYIEEYLPPYGILKNSEGFVYVDLDDEYIYQLIPFIENDDFERPPFFGSSDLVGAHITVIYPDEIKNNPIPEAYAWGETIYFTPKECQVVYPPSWDGINEVYLITVDAPNLDKIRQMFGLPEKKYNFHITIGVKRKESKSA